MRLAREGPAEKALQVPRGPAPPCPLSQDSGGAPIAEHREGARDSGGDNQALAKNRQACLGDAPRPQNHARHASCSVPTRSSRAAGEVSRRDPDPQAQRGLANHTALCLCQLHLPTGEALPSRRPSVTRGTVRRAHARQTFSLQVRVP